MEQVLVFLYTSFMNVRSGVIKIVFGWMLSSHCHPEASSLIPVFGVNLTLATVRCNIVRKHVSYHDSFL